MNVENKLIKKKLRIDGYYFDGKKSFHLFKDERGNSTIKKVTKIYREKI
jgi:hypothetical protein